MSQPVSLLSLPIEVLDQIFGLLSKETLIRATPTSKTISQLAQPFIYRSVTFRTPFSFVDGLLTLLRCPDLRPHVRTFSYVIPVHHRTLDNSIKAYVDREHKYLNFGTLSRQELEILNMCHLGPGLGVIDEDASTSSHDIEGDASQHIIAAVLCLLPRLETFIIDWPMMHFEMAFDPKLYALDRDLTQILRQRQRHENLDIRFPPVKDLIILGRSGSRHLRSCSTLYRIPTLKRLISDLSIHVTILTEAGILAGLEELQVGGGRSDQGWLELLPHLESLRVFRAAFNHRFTVVREEGFHDDSLNDALLSRADTLQTLKLTMDWGRPFEVPGAEGPDLRKQCGFGPEGCLACLPKMTNLVYLKVDLALVYSTKDHLVALAPIEVFPPSLQTLYLVEAWQGPFLLDILEDPRSYEAVVGRLLLKLMSGDLLKLQVVGFQVTGETLGREKIDFDLQNMKELIEGHEDSWTVTIVPHGEKYTILEARM